MNKFSFRTNYIHFIGQNFEGLMLEQVTYGL